MTARSLRRLAGVALVTLGLVGAAVPALTTTSSAATPRPATAVTPATGHVGSVAATVSSDLFRPASGFELDPDAKLSAAPSHYRAYRVALPELRAELAQAPTATAVASGAAPLEFSLPDPTGAVQRFSVQEDSVMQAGLQAAHPDMRTYAGTSLTDPGTTIRLDVTPLGFHASVNDLGHDAEWLVDPAYVGRNQTTDISYYAAAMPTLHEPFVERDLKDTVSSLQREVGTAGRTAAGAEVTRRIYRLALVSDQTYAKYFGDNTAVLAAKVTLINRVDEVYNNDFAIKFVLIDGTGAKLDLGTDALATGADGPCGASACYTAAELASCGSSTLSRNDFVLGQLVGADTFDIGHIALGTNGGGIAGLGVVGTGTKGEGCTGIPTPKGDFYAIDYVAHEMGHEMGANHPFNGTQVNCSSTNRNAGTSVEPGSGTSVMAYAGICGSDDLQPHSDPYFSQRSIDEITDNTSATPGTENEVQVVTLAGFGDDAADSFDLTYTDPTGVVHTPVTIDTSGVDYTSLSVSSAIFQLTGCRVTLAGYDSSSPQLSDDGFQITFNLTAGCRQSDIPTLGITGFKGGTTVPSGFVGTTTNGGPDTNGGSSTNLTGNHAPTVTAPAAYDIPIQTPFTLTGSGTDVDGDKLIYTWEQNDQGSATGGTGLTDQPKLNGPLFRMFGTYAAVDKQGTLLSPSPGENLATGDSSRTFPDLDQVLAGTTNAATGSCPTPTAADTTSGVANTALKPGAILDCFSEFLPTADYGALASGLPALSSTLDFRLTARDQFPTGGGTQYADTVLTVDSADGPLLVTSRATPGTTAAAGASETVTWAVNGTDATDLAPQVKISLSTDGGHTYPYVLDPTTANDGTDTVTLPQVSTRTARIKVEAVGNIFFDVNDADFVIAGPLTVTTPADQTVQYSDDLTGPVTVSASSSKADASALTSSMTGAPAGLKLTFDTAASSGTGVTPSEAVYDLTGPVTGPPGTYPTTVTIGDGTESKPVTFDVVVTAEDATASYTGSKAITTPNTSVSVPLTSTITEATDPTPGSIANASVTFVDRATGATLCTVAAVTAGADPASGTATCDATLASSAAGTSYTIGTVVGGDYRRDSTDDDAVITVTQSATTPPGTNPAPQTTIVSGPSPSSFVLTFKTAFGLRSSIPGSTFLCALDGKALPCGTITAVKHLKPGTHVFKAIAKSPAGVFDKTPVVRVFAAPYNDQVLTVATRGWTSHKDASYYRANYTSTSQKGQRLTEKATDITRLSLVASRGEGDGRVAIYVGNRLIRKISLAGSAKKTVSYSVGSFTTPLSGTVKIVTLGNKTVRIDGLGILVAP